MDRNAEVIGNMADFKDSSSKSRNNDLSNRAWLILYIIGWKSIMIETFRLIYIVEIIWEIEWLYHFLNDKSDWKFNLYVWAINLKLIIVVFLL